MPFSHGTISGFTHYGCRCTQCGDAQRTGWRRVTNIQHGTLGAYLRWRCRCPECVESHRTYMREWARLDRARMGSRRAA